MMCARPDRGEIVWLEHVVPIVEMGSWEAGIPFVRVDASGRPDLADLGRVLELDGGGPTSVGWQTLEGRRLLLLDAMIERPVRCPLQLVFTLATDGALLRAIAHTGRLAVWTGPAGDATGFVLVLDGEALAGLLDALGVPRGGGR